MIAGANNLNELHSKNKALTTLFPYAIWRERDGQPEMLDAFLRAARASMMSGVVWDYVGNFTSTLLHEATPRAIVLVSPHIPWCWLTGGGDFVQLWVAATSAVQHAEEVAQGVVNTLLQIASEDELSPYITVNVWSWLTMRPSLPPVCSGRFRGSYPHVIKTVRELGDIEVLKSYLLLVWSEWDALRGGALNEMQALIREDFGGIGMGHHRVGLIQRLDRILWRLGLGFRYLQKRNPNLWRYELRAMKDQYRQLRNTLLETNLDAISRTLYPVTLLPSILTQVDIHRISRHVYVCASSAVSIASLLEPSTPLISIPSPASSVTELQFPHQPIAQLATIPHS